MIIERPRLVRRIKGTKKWVLVYGRRKTGKTFLVENFTDYDEYFFIKRDRTIISKSGSKTMNYETFIEILSRALEDKKTIVVDEFHRLGEDFFEFLHHTKKQGKLILISSTLFLSKKLFSGKSALLGLFAELPIGLIDTEDSIAAIKKSGFLKKQLVEAAILLREPIGVDYFNKKKKPQVIMAEIIISSINTIPALIGEIFIEEEREISAIYEGILRAIAGGKIISSEISSYLFSRKLIKKDDPSIVQQYLNNLVSFGIIKKLMILNKKRFVYKHISPLAKIFYYADEKYNISERIVKENEIESIIDKLMPRIVEDTIREFLAEKYGLIETISEGKDYDIDGCLLKFKKPEIILEVKWKKVTKKDILKTEKNLQNFAAKEKLLFVQDKSKLKNIRCHNIRIVDIGDFLE